MKPAAFSPGFRLSVRDGAVLIVGGIGAFLGERDTAIIIGMAVGHFFLFCNVFRVRTKLELIWAAIFCCLTVFTLVFHQPGWPVTIGVSLACAAALIVIEMKSPSYHGIGWRRINPKLPEWWEAQSKR
jgi:hypothetical protein